MDSVLSAFIILFVLIFALFAIAGGIISTSDTLYVAWQAMEARSGEQASTGLQLVSAKISDSGTAAELVYRNSGSAKLSDFDQWDLMVQYTDGSSPANYRSLWLPYTNAMPVENEWAVVGLYTDAAKDEAEILEPEVLNPGEELVVRAKLWPPVGVGKALTGALATNNGISEPVQAHRNVPPIILVNSPLTVTVNGHETILPDILAASDEDDGPRDLVYTIVTPPTRGTLNFAETFTQADIDAGLVGYTHAGGGDDAFTFHVSDGDDVTADMTFTIETNHAPILVTNTGLNVSSNGTVTLSSAFIEALDMDGLPAELTFTVVSGPMRGSLNRLAFTQADIETGNVVYTHTGGGNDGLTFMVSDGKAKIGPFTLLITVVP